jgi:hypothetical protein
MHFGNNERPKRKSQEKKGCKNEFKNRLDVQENFQPK